jgi:hypothetical protein
MKKRILINQRLTTKVIMVIKEQFFFQAAITFFSFVLFNSNCSSVKDKYSRKINTNDSLVVFYDSTLSGRLNQNISFDSIKVMFLGIFEDTLVVFRNGIQILKFGAYIKEYPTNSSDYSGHSVGIEKVKRKQIITIKLLNQKRTIEFWLQNGFPLCTVQRYNGIWYINYRYGLQLK